MLHDILNNPDVQAAIQGLILAVATSAAGVITVAIRRIATANVSARNLDLIEQAARMAVLYAEQTGLATTGADKLAAAMAAADQILTANGVNVTSEQLRVAIEAAVRSALNDPFLTPLVSHVEPVKIAESPFA